MKRLIIWLVGCIGLISTVYAIEFDHAFLTDHAYSKGGVVVADGNKTDRFTRETKEIHLVAHYKNARKSDKVTAVWIAVDAVAQPNYQIAAFPSDLSKGQGEEGYLHVYLARGLKPWPAGRYRVTVLSTGGGVLLSKEFRIEEKKQTPQEKARSGVGVSAPIEEESPRLDQNPRTGRSTQDESAKVSGPEVSDESGKVEGLSPDQSVSEPKSSEGKQVKGVESESVRVVPCRGIRKDERGKITPEGASDHFGSKDSKVYAWIPYKVNKDGVHRYRIEWSYFDTKQNDWETIAEERGGFDGRRGQISSELTLDEDLPAGSYRIKVWIDDQVKAEAKFVRTLASEARNHQAIGSSLTQTVNSKSAGTVAVKSDTTSASYATPNRYISPRSTIGNNLVSNSQAFQKTRSRNIPTPIPPEHLRGDIDGDGRDEIVAWRWFGKNDVGDFYQILVFDDDHRPLWEGPVVMNSDNRFVFGKWDFGESLPQALVDIDGDGMAELLAPAPQSDVSPTYYRILAWNGSRFIERKPGALMQDSWQPDRFVWRNPAPQSGVLTWVSGMKSLSVNSVQAEITRSDGSSVTMGSAVLRFDAGGARVERWLQRVAQIAPQPSVIAGSGQGYVARIGPRDLYNSRGVPLRSIMEILHQDRANYHKGWGDPEDQDESYFRTVRDRRRMDRMRIVPVGTTMRELRRAIRNDHPLLYIEPSGKDLRVQIMMER